MDQHEPTISIRSALAGNGLARARRAHISYQMMHLTDWCITKFYLSLVECSLKDTYRVLLLKVAEINSRRPADARERAPSYSYLCRRIKSLDPYRLSLSGKVPKRLERSPIPAHSFCSQKIDAMQNRSMSPIGRNECSAPDRSRRRREKIRGLRSRSKVPGELGPTWLLDVRRIAGYVWAIACEMPIGKPLEIDISNGSAAQTLIEFLSRLGARAGYPERVLVNRSARFKAPQFESWCESEGIAVVYLAPVGIAAISDRQFRKLHGLETLGPNPTLAECRHLAARLIWPDL